MEGSASEAAFDALGLNPQLFINEVLNAVDDMVESAFELFVDEASKVIDGGADRAEELAKGASSLRHLTQAILDKRMGMWENYCLRHCFSVPEGFVLPKDKDPSGDVSMLQEGLSDSDHDAQLDSLRERLAAVGRKSEELHREILSLEKHSTLSTRYDASVAQALQLYEKNSVHEKFQDMGKTASRLRQKMAEMTIKSMEDMGQARAHEIHRLGKEQFMGHDRGLSARLEDILEVVSILRSL